MNRILFLIHRWLGLGLGLLVGSLFVATRQRKAGEHEARDRSESEFHGSSLL